MSRSSNPKIYFHVGLGKTGTTFLQYRAFPKFKDLHYIQRTKFKKAINIIDENKYDKYFVSYECDQQLEKVAKKFSNKFPETRTIIVLRSHSSWIASQYRRFVKNGHHLSFKEFIDIKNDQGFFKLKDLSFFNQIKLLEKYFDLKPIVLF